MDSIIAIESESLHVGESVRVVCPYCGGGSTQEESLVITRISSATCLWKCHRDKCDKDSGYINSRHSVKVSSTAREPKEEVVLKTSLLTKEDIEFFKLRFSIREYLLDEFSVSVSEDGRIVYPLYNFNRIRIANTLRNYSELSNDKSLLKNKVVKEAGHEGQVYGYYWNNPVSITDDLIIVEDATSAIATSEYCDALALTGTHISDELANTLASIDYTNIYLCLDADATRKAIKLVDRFSAILPNMQARRLERDIKDLNAQDRADKIGFILSGKKPVTIGD